MSKIFETLSETEQIELEIKSRLRTKIREMILKNEAKKISSDPLEMVKAVGYLIALNEVSEFIN